MTAELTENYTPLLESLTLIPSSGGRFEVKVDDDLIFSKKALDRHAQPGEVVRLFEEKLGLSPDKASDNE